MHVKETMEEPDQMTFGFTLGLIMKIFVNSIPMWLMDPMCGYMLHTSAMFTNVRGSPVKQKCFGHDVLLLTAYVTMWKNLGY